MNCECGSELIIEYIKRGKKHFIHFECPNCPYEDEFDCHEHPIFDNPLDKE